MRLKSGCILGVILCFLASAAVCSAAQDLTWSQCVQEAAKNHPDLIAAVESIKQSQAVKQETASGLYPQISANLSAQASKSSSANKQTNTYAYGVSGSQLIFDGIKTINNVRAAGESIKASQQGYRFTSSEVRLRLRTAFINLLKAQEMVKVTGEIVKIRRDNLELITLSYESGLEHKGALLTTQADLASANFQLAQAKRDIELAQHQLVKEMGLKEFKRLSVTGDFKVNETASEKPDFDVLADKHPSLLQAAAQKNAAEFSLRSTYGNFFPNLSVQAGADKTGPRWSPANSQWDLGAFLSLPLFEGGLRTAQLSQAKALYNQLEASERSTRDGLIVGLSSAWVSLQDAVETVDVQNKQLLAAQERSKIAEAEYSTGFISYDNWTIIEDNLVRAKTDYLSAQAEALLAEASWIQAKGENLEYAQN